MANTLVLGPLRRIQEMNHFHVVDCGLNVLGVSLCIMTITLVGKDYRCARKPVSE